MMLLVAVFIETCLRSS